MEILNQTLILAERAAFLEPNNVEYVCELGYQSLLTGKYPDAKRHYKNATKMDDSNLNGLVGGLLCEFLEDHTDSYDQIDALEEFQQATDINLVCCQNG